MLQKVIDYEFSTIQQKSNPQYSLPKLDLRNYRYSDWNLNDVIRKIPQAQCFNLKWIGNDKNAHLMSLFFCLVMGSLHSGKKKDQNFIRLKFYLYQMCQQFLSVQEQKLFVQNICLFQNSKNIIQFLSKNKSFELLIIKIFQKYIHKDRTVNNSYLQKFQQLKFLSQMFDFLSFQIEQYNVIKLVLSNTIFYIIVEKQCFFVYYRLVYQSRIENPDNHQKIIQKCRNNSKKKYEKKIKGLSFDQPVNPIIICNQNQNYQTPSFTFQNSARKLQRQQSNRKQFLQILKDQQYSDNQEQLKNSDSNVLLINSQKIFRDLNTADRIKFSHNHTPLKEQKKKSLSLQKKPKRKKVSNDIRKDINQFKNRDKQLYQSLGVCEKDKYKQYNKNNNNGDERKKAPKFILQKKKTDLQDKSYQLYPFPQNNLKSFKEPTSYFSKSILIPPNRHTQYLYSKKKQK